MKNLQNDRVFIAFEPIPHKVCNYIITDYQWLQENILCLLSNAVKYSSVGKVTLTVSFLDPAQAVELRLVSLPHKAVTTADSDGCCSADVSNFASTTAMLKFTIEDTGIGISQDEMDKLFNPFKQAQRLAGKSFSVSIS